MVAHFAERKRTEIADRECGTNSDAAIEHSTRTENHHIGGRTINFICFVTNSSALHARLSVDQTVDTNRQQFNVFGQTGGRINTQCDCQLFCFAVAECDQCRTRVRTARIHASSIHSQFCTRFAEFGSGAIGRPRSTGKNCQSNYDGVAAAQGHH